MASSRHFRGNDTVILNEEELLTKLIETEERSKSNTHRLNHMEKEYGELGKSINRMATAVEVLATEQKHSTDEQRKMRETMTQTADRVASLEIAPSKSSVRSSRRGETSMRLPTISPPFT